MSVSSRSRRDAPDPTRQIRAWSARLPGSASVMRAARAIGVAQHLERQAVGVEDGIATPAASRPGEIDWREVAGPVEQADADDRNAEVGRALQVVAGEDAEAAGVLGQRGGDAEFRREVPDRCRRIVGKRLVPAWLLEVGVQIVPQRVGAADEGLVVGELFQPRRFDGGEQIDRVGAQLAPDHRRDVGKEPAGGNMPRPPQVRREFFERRQRCLGSLFELSTVLLLSRQYSLGESTWQPLCRLWRPGGLSTSGDDFGDVQEIMTDCRYGRRVNQMQDSFDYQPRIGRIPIRLLAPQQPDNLWPSKAYAWARWCRSKPRCSRKATI